MEGPGCNGRLQYCRARIRQNPHRGTRDLVSLFFHLSNHLRPCELAADTPASLETIVYLPSCGVDGTDEPNGVPFGCEIKFLEYEEELGPMCVLSGHDSIIRTLCPTRGWAWDTYSEGTMHIKIRYGRYGSITVWSLSRVDSQKEGGCNLLRSHPFSSCLINTANSPSLSVIIPVQ
jgi:hypothetical protein